MTTKDTALRLALEALGTSRIMAVDEAGNYTREVTPKVITEAITACREALAQPAGERGELIEKINKQLGNDFDPEDCFYEEEPLFKAAALLSSDAQPSEWVGLTPDERRVVIDQWRWDDGDTHDLCVAIESKLREKNAGKLFEDSLFFHEVKNSSNKLAPWLSAALEDPNSCSEFKAAIEWWFQSGITDKKHWPEAGKTVGINGLTHEEESATASVMGLVAATEDRTRQCHTCKHSDSWGLADCVLPGECGEDKKNWEPLNPHRHKPAANQCKPMGLEESVTDVGVCCGEYAKCHRACTPRGRWQATQETAADKAGGDEPFLFIYFDPTAGTHGSHRVAETHPPPADAFPVYTRPQPQEKK